MARVSVFGLGYVGAVTAACLAHKGHEVVGVDINPAKVNMVESGKAPVLEPRLEELIAEGRRSSRLHATTDAHAAVRKSDISFICVGTPATSGASQSPAMADGSPLALTTRRCASGTPRVGRNCSACDAMRNP